MRKARSFLINACLVAAGALAGLALAELWYVFTSEQGSAAQAPGIAAGETHARQIHACLANLNCI
jgi:hypothetical protein